MADLEFAILANYAEAPPGNGLLYVMGGTWDTLTVGAPLEGAPPNVVAALNGHVVVRLRFHHTETNKDHTLGVVIVDEDGQQIAELKVGFRVQRVMGLPTSWGQGSNIVLPLTGIGLPKFGIYEISFLLNNNHLGNPRPFRVLKGY